MGLRMLVAVLIVALAAPACVDDQVDGGADVVLGIGSTQEQQLLAAVTVSVLDRADISVERRAELGDTRELRREAMGGRIDLFWDYTGYAWALGLRQESPVADAEESYELVRKADQSRGLIWLAPSKANATLALFIRADELDKDEALGGMTGLAARLSRGEDPLCADEDFVNRSGGLEDLAALYGMNLEQLQVVEATEQQAVDWVASGRCFAGLATATSGDARRLLLVPVSDDRLVFPAFVVAPVARAQALEDVPGLEDALSDVTERLGTRDLAELNGLVAAGGDLQQVAEEYVTGLLGPPPT